jgi:hypothetical protein
MFWFNIIIVLHLLKQFIQMMKILELPSDKQIDYRLQWLLFFSDYLSYYFHSFIEFYN